MNHQPPLYANRDYDPENVIETYPFDGNDIFSRMGACMLSGDGKSAGRYPVNPSFFPHAFQEIGRMVTPSSTTRNLGGWYPVFSRPGGIPNDLDVLSFGDNDVGGILDKCVVVGKITSKRVLGLLTLHANLRKVVQSISPMPSDIFPIVGASNNRHHSPAFYLSNNIDITLAEDMGDQIRVFDEQFLPRSEYAYRGGRTAILRVGNIVYRDLQNEIRGGRRFMLDHGIKVADEAATIFENDLILVTDPHGVCESIQAILNRQTRSTLLPQS